MINITNIGRLDLNLLLVFHCLMTERSVTRAASMLHITQGAVSASLKRLREHFGDELFVRTGSGMVPTHRALDLAPKVAEALAAVSSMTGNQASAPVEVSRRIFNIALSDDLETCLSPALVCEANARSLGISFAFHQTNSVLWKSTLSDPDIDLVLCSEPKELTSQFSSQVLFSSSYSCLYDGRRLKVNSPISRQEYLTHNHVRVSYDGRRGFVDDLFQAEGAVRRVCASFTHFGGVLSVLAQSDAIATLPTFAAHAYARITNLTVSPVPIPVPAFRVFMIWRVQSTGDEQNQWLRNFVVERTSR